MQPRILVLFALGSTLVGQCPPSESLFAGAPIALSMREIPGVTFDPAQVYRKQVGFLTSAPAMATFPSGLHFDLPTVLRSCGAATPPDVDDITLGRDWILADNATGRVAIPPDRWAALTFSVTRGTQGQAGGTIRTEVGRPDGAAADVFSFYLPGSAIPAELVARTYRALDSREIDLGTGGTRNDIDGLDLFIPMYGMEPGLVAMLPTMPRLFFTVSAATLSRAPATWFANSTPSAATILEIDWGGTRGWSCPRPFMTYAALGLTAADDVDGLAIDLANQRILFSTTSTRLNPIMFMYYGTDHAAAVPYVDSNNVPIADKIGLIGSDDVDAICALDPSIRAGQTGPNPAYFAFGVPRPTVVAPPTPGLSASAFRTYSSGQIAIQSFVDGWPSTGPGPGIAVLFLTLPNSLNPIVMLSQQARNPAATFCGDPRRVPINIPAALTLSGTPVFLRWVVTDQAFTTLGEAHPLQVRI